LTRIALTAALQSFLPAREEDASDIQLDFAENTTRMANLGAMFLGFA